MSQFLIPDLKEEMVLTERFITEYLAPVSLNQTVDHIFSHVLSARGKRIRPQLLLLAGRYGKHYHEKREGLCRLGALVELVHLASLIHDDIVDDSPLRRGRPTVQAHFGKDMAVYAGDLVLSRAMQILFSEKFYEAGKWFGITIEKMCTGEIGQYARKFQPETGIEDYRRNIYGKTAALFELACRLGASEAGCDRELSAFLESIGRNFGILFQMRDDLLDYLSVEEKEGKPTGRDFEEGILTLPVLYALEAQDYADEIRKLIRLAKEGDFHGEERKRLSALIRESGGMKKALRDYRELSHELARQVGHLPAQKETKMFAAILEKLAVPI